MSTCQLLISASEHDADMLYASGMFVPDPFIAIGINDVWHGLLSPLEVDRARKQSRFQQVHLDSEWKGKAEALGWSGGLAAPAAAFLHAQGITNCTVPGNFPLIYAEQLRAWGFDISAAQGSLFPQRTIKRDDEIKQLAKAEKLTKQSMAQAEHFIAACSVGNDGILRHPDSGKKIKSQDIRSVIEVFLITHGASPSHTIVACGKEGADPHHIGQGYIRAGQPIIIDIFPRLVSTGYWGDMTRTYVKGKAPADIKKLYQAVLEGQDIGLSMVCDGVSGLSIHQAITQHFDRLGFKTGLKRGKQTGFFHGTGHGVGLDIHEMPRISSRDDTLKTNHVVTVEPGLYYPNLGGVRLEDLVVVQDNGCRNLTCHPRKLEII